MKGRVRVWGGLQFVFTGWLEPTETHFRLLLSLKVAAGEMTTGALNKSIYCWCPAEHCCCWSMCGQRGSETGKYIYSRSCLDGKHSWDCGDERWREGRNSNAGMRMTKGLRWETWSQSPRNRNQSIWFSKWPSAFWDQEAARRTTTHLQS